jgi:phosphatidylinositol 4-kinase
MSSQTRFVHESSTHSKISCSWFQYNHIYEFHSARTGITLQLTDNYQVRNEILALLHRNANNWFELALGRAPIDLQSTLQAR